MPQLLFIAYVDGVIRKVIEEVIDLDGDIIFFTKDLACWSVEMKVVKKLVIDCTGCFEVSSLKMNVEKTEIMSVGREEAVAIKEVKM